MSRDQLAHVLRAATRISGDGDIVVLGSQSILGTYSDTEFPAEATMSVEADLAWRNDPDDQPTRSAHSDTHNHGRKHPHGVRLRPFVTRDNRLPTADARAVTVGGRFASGSLTPLT